MNFKTTLILALVFVIGVTGVVLMNKSDEQKKEQKELEGKLLDVEKENITGLAFKPSGVNVIKQGDEWVINEPVQTDGDKSTIESITGMFEWAKIERKVSEDPAEYSIYGLDPVKGSLIVTHSNGADTLFLGDKTPTGSYVFARKSGMADVFLTSTSLESNINKTLFDLRNKEALQFEKNDVRTFELTNKKETFVFEKQGTDWAFKSPFEGKADNSEVDKIVNRLDTERAKEYVDEDPDDLRKYGLSKPSYIATFALGENKATKRLIIGKALNDQFYAKDESRKPVFLVDSAFVSLMNVDLKTLRNKKIIDFVASDIGRMEINFADTTFICEKDTADNWMIKSPIERKAKNWKISSINTAIVNLNVKEFVNDAPASLGLYGLANPSVSGKFYRGEDLLAEILVGKKTGEDMVYLKLANEKPVYAVDDLILEKLKVNLEDVSEAEEQASAPSSQ